MKSIWIIVVACVTLSGAGPGCVARQGIVRTYNAPAERTAVTAVLNDLHDAAAKADESRYFSCFARNGIFLGTDDTERWTVAEFREYAHKRFATGQGWTYTVAERFISFSSDGEVAWFDERLDNAKYGRCRGSGVLVKSDGDWKIAQYNLTVPIPNDLLPEVARRVKESESR